MSENDTKAPRIEVPEGVSRRDFLKLSGAVAACLGLSSTFIPKIAHALATAPRPPIVWLNFAECTGCTEAFLRSSNPTVGDLLLDVVSLDYHETVMAAAGLQANTNLDTAVAKYPGQFICICEGAVPTAEGGVYGAVGGDTMLATAQAVVPKAKHVVCVGTCASYGGLPAAAPNPTGAKGVADATGYKTINIPGCPPNPITLVSLLASYLLNGTMPALDSYGRPLFAYGKSVHDQCGKPYGCLKEYGCRGPRCRNNCPTMKFNDKTSWCIQAEHHCIGCSEPGFWDTMAPFYNADYVRKFIEDRGLAGSRTLKA